MSRNIVEFSMKRLTPFLLIVWVCCVMLFTGFISTPLTHTSAAQQPVATSVPGALDLADTYIRNPRLGIAHISAAEGGTSPERYRQALALGAGWNRWPLYWNHVEGVKGEYDWSEYDRQVADDLRFGLQINAILLGRPDFYAEENSLLGINNPIFADGSDFPGEDKTLNPDNPWVNFVYAAVQRYKPGGTLAQQSTTPEGKGVTVWEVWNEPDFTPFWSAGIREYARLLKISYLTIKHADPYAQVMVGGLTYSGEDNWLARVLAIFVDDAQSAANNYFMDIVAVHSYANPWRTGWLVLVARQTLVAYELDRPIWLNETGVPVWDDYPGPTWATTTETRARRSTLEQQAWFYIQSAVYAWTEGADVVIYHQLYDDCGDQPAGSNFPPHNGELCVADAVCYGDAHGMFRNLTSSICFAQSPEAGNPRPAASAFQLLTQVFAQPFGKGKYVTLGDGVEAMVFKRTQTDENIYVFWNRTFDPIEVTLPAEGDDAQMITLESSEIVRPDGENLYRFDLPPAKPDDYPQNPVGADAAIGGAPVIVIEKPGGKIEPLVVNLEISGVSTSAVSLATAMPGPTRTPLAPPRATVDPASDNTPPTASINSLPVISASTFTVSWRGQDNSGIALYQVWVRVDSGAWTPWLETLDTSAEYIGQPGSLYEFDVWAQDLAGNWSTNVTLTPRAVTRVQ